MLSNDDDDDDDDDSPADTSLLLLERAVADVELIQAAYPDEVEIIDPPTAAAAGSIIIQFHLSDTAHVCVEFPSGYPTKSALQIVSYRSQDKNKHRIERVVTVLRNVAQECWENECEGGLSCCAAALEAWNDIEENEQTAAAAAVEEQQHPQVVESSYTTFQWISGISITDRKSTFQAHACQVHTEADIRQALDQLMEGNGRIQKAYHNMFAWRLTETLSNGTTVLKHDNDNDGEDCAGSRLAQLLEMRKEMGILVVVSRWYGGIPLGPKRFAHITNAARDVLLLGHDTMLWDNTTMS